MTTLVAFEVDQLSVLNWPVVIEDGEAAKLIVGSGSTVTAACRVIVPPLPLAVRVYVVVAEGDTKSDPFRGCAPRPLSMLTEVVFAVVQDSVEDWPLAMLVGEAVNVAEGPGWMTVTVTCRVTVPPGPVPVSV